MPPSVGACDTAKLAVLNVGYRGYITGEETTSERRRATEVVLRSEVWAERRVLSRFVKTPQRPSLTVREQQP